MLEFLVKLINLPYSYKEVFRLYFENSEVRMSFNQ